MGPNEKPKELPREAGIAGDGTYREIEDVEVPDSLKTKGWLGDDLDETLPITDELKQKIVDSKRMIG